MVVVVLELELDELEDGLVVVVVFVVSFVFSVVGFTTVVLFSTFFSGAGEEPGATTVSFCSHAPRSAALAKMQNSFFISFWIGCPSWTNLNRIMQSFRPCPNTTLVAQRLLVGRDSVEPSENDKRGSTESRPTRSLALPNQNTRYNGALYFSPCASATASYVTLPSRVLIPPMSAGCFLHAPSRPRSARSSA